jgi:hypothetical protein
MSGLSVEGFLMGDNVTGPMVGFYKRNKNPGSANE